MSRTVISTITRVVKPIMPHDSRFSHLRALWRIMLLLAGTLVLVIVQLFWVLLTAIVRFLLRRRGMSRHQSPVVRAWYSYCTWLSGVKVTVVNRRSLSRKQKIILSNHTSYLDILILGAYFDCFFVAKMDIAGWPVFGFLAKIGGTLFIQRQRQFIRNQLALLEKHLQARQSLLIFPEGTTNDGMSIQSFKSSLLNAAYNVPKAPLIQPVTILYTHMNGKKLETREECDRIAWYGDMTLAPHLWYVFRQKSIEAKIIIHPVIKITAENDAKTVTHQAREAIVEGFVHAHPVLQEKLA